MRLALAGPIPALGERIHTEEKVIMNIGIPALAASGVFLGGTLAAPADMSKGGDGRYVLPIKFGLGGVPLGNE